VRRAEAGARHRSERRVAIKQGSPRSIPSFRIIIIIIIIIIVVVVVVVVVVTTMTALSHL
jgi:flagellar basal body-associated protein FliL